jgi:hypothetical protein
METEIKILPIPFNDGMNFTLLYYGTGNVQNNLKLVIFYL